MSDLRVKLPAPCPESWDAMAPSGCNRHCASCDKIIHDLEQMTIGDLEALIADSEDICVRARIDGAGKVALKSDSWRGARRMIATVGAGFGLMAAGSAAMAAEQRVYGAIHGQVDDPFATKAIATDTAGKRYKTRIKSNGSYKFKKLPPGTYTVHLFSSCAGEDQWGGSAVEVRAGIVTNTAASNPNQCIIVGKLVIDKVISEG
jgi:hypothetical protein